MKANLPRNRLRLWCLLTLLAVTAAFLFWALQDSPALEAPPVTPIQIHSDPWHVGTDVELTLRSAVPRARQYISVTVLAPGPGSPRIEGIAADFFGLSGVQIPWLLPEYQGVEMALAAASGARYIGLDFDWRRLEPQRGQYVWKDTDEVVALAKQHQLKLVPMLLYTPQWASTTPFAPLDYHHAPPVDFGDYRNFVYAIVNRYKPHGASPLTDDGYGITDWVIWNEPNLRSTGMEPEPSGSWTGSLEEYLLLLRAGYEGAHAADPDCNVLNGGLADIFWAEGGLYLRSALERFYDPDGDGDASDGARPFFDTLNIHTYQVDTPEAIWYQDRLEAIVQVMERFGDGQKPIWVTETGYGSVTPPAAESPYLDEETQAHTVTLVYRALSAYPQVERVFWWSLRDYYVNASATNEAMEAHYGLVRANFMPKPVYLAYGRLTGRVGQVLTLTSVTDEKGVAMVTVPATFVSQPGAYVLFAHLESVEPATVVIYDASTAGGE